MIRVSQQFLWITLALENDTLSQQLQSKVEWITNSLILFLDYVQNQQGVWIAVQSSTVLYVLHMIHLKFLSWHVAELWFFYIHSFFHCCRLRVLHLCVLLNFRRWIYTHWPILCYIDWNWMIAWLTTWQYI